MACGVKPDQGKSAICRQNSRVSGEILGDALTPFVLPHEQIGQL
jgi:hypothetical protein